ncbi:MAG: hypothetical protein AB7S26_03630 [Sandaracinaceae bacterium]
MLIYLYLFSLIVGGVLLGASILLGGKDVEADASTDADVDADGDVEAEVDADADADGDVAAASDQGFGHGDAAGFIYTFLSLRFWVFFLAFFGLTGITLDGLDLVPSSWIGLALATVMGGASGAAAVTLVRKLGSDRDSRVVSERDYIGKTARVLVPFEGEGLGKVRVDIKGSSIDLLASGLEADAFKGQDEVLIVEMEGPRARVARIEGSSPRKRRQAR